MSKPLPAESQLAANMRAGMLKRGGGGLEMPPPAWTSVEDAAPPDQQLVLLWRAADQSCHIGRHWKHHGGFCTVPGVTHWMPLPEGPEGV